jgi:SAM-dependent methyltransferase
VSGRFTEKFTGKAAVYAKYRPTYPKEILKILGDQIEFTRESVVADIGSGTGILSKIFLENGNAVYSVEPNNSMRSYAERDLSMYPQFHSVAAIAEDTGLPGSSIDLVTAGQALHWFDRERARKEFARILKPTGYALIVYNERKKEDGMMDDYDKIIDRNASKSETPDVDAEYLSQFYEGGHYKEFTVPNEQALDFDGLLGRASSASYLPSRDQPGFESLEKDLRELFDTYEQKGKIILRYETLLFLGQVPRGSGMPS